MVTLRQQQIKDLKTELESVERFLHALRHNRGRWPRKWTTGMIRHYEDRREYLRGRISTLKRRRKR